MATGSTLIEPVPTPVTGLVPRKGRSAGAWVAFAAGPGLVLTGLLAMGSPAPAPEDVGTVPDAATIGAPPGGARQAPVTVEGADLPPAAPGGGRRTPASSAAARPGAPVRLELPRFAISAPIEPVGVDAKGSLSVPENPDVLGWWRSGARPGGGRGTVVVDGHVDSARYGLGVFAKLAELDPGDAVHVVTGSGQTHRYVVTGRRLYRKAVLPAGEIFDQQGAERLVLVSCGGSFDGQLRTYSHNVVVYATPAG
jgi:hypothetical protein